jgi:hypothetical protein
MTIRRRPTLPFRDLFDSSGLHDQQLGELQLDHDATETESERLARLDAAAARKAASRARRARR